ncbi:DMP19 family protein [Pseudarthrobacter sp. NamE5]|uniref:DMP19 family protein n=1 Tax=Pseudarthrobacter sp. NamE5 TaxID=2576839 RepID=UPI001F0DDD14|nr:DMP19 family protein [Pseudarthrobacter sp. NamE5]
MITSQQPVVLTSSSIHSSDEDVVEASAGIVEAMHAALLRIEEMSPVAVRSYAVDFYLSQALEGGFAQYVSAAVDRVDMDSLIREGMAGMGATAHLDLFNRAAEAFDGLSDEDAGVTPDGVLRMEELDGEFEELLERENITACNAAWLRSQAELLVLDDDEVGAYIERLASMIPDLPQRKAQAEAAALAEDAEAGMIGA